MGLWRGPELGSERRFRRRLSRERQACAEVSQRCAEVAPGHDVAGDLRTIELAALNNPIGLVFARGQPDLKEFAVGRA